MSRKKWPGYAWYAYEKWRARTQKQMMGKAFENFMRAQVAVNKVKTKMG